MRVLMLMQHVNFFRNLDAVVRELDRRGHEIVLLHGTTGEDSRSRARLADKRRKMAHLGRGISVVQSDVPGVEVGIRPEPPERWHAQLRVGRQIISRAIYFRPNHPSPDRVTDALDRALPRAAQKAMSRRAVQVVLRQPFALKAWRRIEAVSRPSKSLLALLRDIRPDVVVVSPTIWPKRPVEADYIRAARSLGIPTIGYLNSWDNLTSKGTVHVIPDVYAVWNEALAREAAELHDVPREVIRITGAAHLDRFFQMSASVSHAEICERMGCPTDAPYLVYLCSSRTLMQSEVHVATALADALAKRFPIGTPTLVVRPHPTNPSPWEGYDHPGVVVHPKSGDQADSPESWQEYFDQLSGATCVFGLNTTAFLEAVAADRPCLTIVSDEFYPAQGKTGHFRHLLHADFLEVSSDADGVAERVARIQDGVDEKAAGRKFFTDWFLRPCGAETPAAIVVADLIESVASGEERGSTEAHVALDPLPASSRAGGSRR